MLIQRGKITSTDTHNHPTAVKKLKKECRNLEKEKRSSISGIDPSKTCNGATGAANLNLNRSPRLTQPEICKCSITID
ncbi:hypothetical protein C5167_041628 [Papaver somniferum]|nr:hypothetical protein C5167_041628 [Papaver somniferum]